MDRDSKFPIASFPQDFLEKNKFQTFRSIEPQLIVVETLFVYMEYCILYKNEQRIDFLLDLLRSSGLERGLLDSLRTYINSALAQGSLDSIEVIRKDPSVFEALDATSEELYTKAEEVHTGHSLYEIIAQFLNLNYAVVQLMSPNECIEFVHSKTFLLLYILEADNQFIYLYPKPEWYGKAWISQEIELEDSLIIKDNAFYQDPAPVSLQIDPQERAKRTETPGNFEEEKHEERPRVIDRTPHGSQCDSCGRPANNKICYCNLCENCSRNMLHSGLDRCPNCAKKFNNSPQERPVQATYNDILKFLSSQEDEVETALERLNAAETAILKKLTEKINNHKKELNDYKAYLQSTQKKLNRNPHQDARNIPNVQELMQSQVSMEIDEDSLNAVIQLKLPSNQLADIPDLEERNGCSVCNRNTELFQNECGCKVCPKCAVKSVLEYSTKCEKCNTVLSYRMLQNKSEFLTAYAQSQQRKLAENICVNCEAEPDAHLIIKLPCKCRLCFNCVVDVDMKCIVCAANISFGEKEKIRKYLESIAMMDLCTHCQSAKFLVCNCACAECALNLVNSRENRCNSCKIPFARTFYNSVIREKTQICSICKREKEEKDVTNLPCKCIACYPCLKSQSSLGISQCTNCNTFFDDKQRDVIYNRLKKRYGYIKSYEPFCLKCTSRLNLICKCCCKKCWDGKENCSICKQEVIVPKPTPKRTSYPEPNVESPYDYYNKQISSYTRPTMPKTHTYVDSAKPKVAITRPAMPISTNDRSGLPASSYLRSTKPTPTYDPYNYQSKPKQTGEFESKKCAICRRKENIPTVCNTCPVCLECLKKTTDYITCARCKGRYAIEERKRLMHYLS